MLDLEEVVLLVVNLEVVEGLADVELLVLDLVPVKLFVVDLEVVVLLVVDLEVVELLVGVPGGIGPPFASAPVTCE